MKRHAFTLVELLVVIAIIGVLVSLLLPAVQMARESARRTQCTNNLRQVGLAIHLYHDSLGRFPSGYVGDPTHPARDSETLDGPPGWAWGALLLPYLEANNLHDQLDFSLPSWAPANEVAVKTRLPVYLCPSASNSGTAVTVRARGGEALGVFERSTYVANAGHDEGWASPLADWYLVANGPLYRNSNVRAATVLDGLSNTVFLGEHHPTISDKTWVGVIPGSQVCPNNPQRRPFTECDEAATWVLVHSGPAASELEVIHPPNSPLAHVCQMYADHPNGVNVMLGDGSVRFVSQFCRVDIWAAMCSMNGGEPLTELP
jgi:prepilin-type N-terminal cleavage/methylation domain-containing protein/prepilin-type processing-associated H-X9-DG protein